MTLKAKSRQHQFAIVWEFRILPVKKRSFEKAYGPRGDWAQLFRRAKGFVSTELLRDRTTPGRYLTIDYWQSKQAFAAFKRKYRTAYEAFDERCAGLTQSESKLGEFQS